MTFLDKIFEWKTDKLLWVSYLPSLLGLCLTIFSIRLEHIEVGLLFLIIGVCCTISCQILYTSVLPFRTLNLKTPVWLVIPSIIVIGLFLVSIAVNLTSNLDGLISIYVFILTLMVTELTRGQRIATFILKKEERTGFMDMILLMWLTLNPLVGLWSFRKRVENLKTVHNRVASPATDR